jgi:hypothetical protein
MIHKPVDAIQKHDIEALVTGGVAEGRTIEYKLTLPAGTDDAKKEFLADVSSFANASGGDLVFGVAATNGIPQNVPGLPGINSDAEKLRLEEIIRTGIEPRIVGLRIVHIDGFSGPVLLVRIPQSFSSPHVVWFKKTSRFYTRNSGGKYQMDVAEIRLAFDASGSISRRLENLRAERLGKIVAGEMPASIPSRSFLVLHIVPLPSFVLSSYIDGNMQNLLLNAFSTITGSISEFRHNLDGFVISAARGHSAGGYCQFFRTGMLESVLGEVVRVNGDASGVASVYYEQRLLAAIGRYLGGLKTLQVPLPFHLTLSLIGVKGAHLWAADTSRWRGENIFDRDAILLPGVIVEEYEASTDQLMRPIFDAMWNAAGFERCFHYDNAGKWVEPVL